MPTDLANVYLDRWQLIAQQDAGDGIPHFNIMFADYPAPPGQREAIVAASIMGWLGTESGLAFRSMAAVISNQLSGTVTPDVAYQMAWTKFNRRRGYLGGGTRLLDLLLTDASHVLREGSSAVGAGVGLADYEAAECVVGWLGSDYGRRFLLECAALRGAMAIDLPPSNPL